MPVLKHTKPCKQCPWTPQSAPGWLGASTPEEFLGQALTECHMPCHIHVNYERKDWREQVAEAPFCAGALIFLKHICKLPRDPVLALARSAVEADRELVFSRPDEFLAHHRRFG